MVVKLFGVLDFIAVVMFILAQWSIWDKFAIVVAIYLIVKALIFITTFASWIDLIAGIYLLLVVFDVHSFFSVIFILWLGQKAFFSLFV
tara:strand:+ start:378 stop:644 length:267 start_codon:yes stop_codon:yes gene_type:complete